MDWDKVLEFIKALEPLLLVIIPFAFGVYLKIKLKIDEKKHKIIKQNDDKNNKKLINWQHEESIRVVNKLKECCNYHCDLDSVHTSFVQLENGTLATSKVYNMFFSCVAEDDRYSSDIKKLTKIMQRIPYIQLSDWYNEVNGSDEDSVYIEDIATTCEFFDGLGIKNIMSNLVHDTDGLVIGICNFSFSDDLPENKIEDYKRAMTSFVSSIETVFLSYKMNVEEMKKKLNLD